MIGATLRASRARVYWEVRTAHLERALSLEPAAILYASRRYDFDEDLAAGLEMHRQDSLAAGLTLLRSRVTAVEITEPLFLNGVLRSAVAVVAARAAAWVRRRPVRIVTYVIGNADPFAVPVRRHPKARLRRLVERRLAFWVARRIDRIAFGTAGAKDVFEATFGRVRGKTALIEALPSPCPCLDGATTPTVPFGVLFLGALEHRKGFDLLCAAWPSVVREEPSARLLVIGKGPLAGQAQHLADTHASVTLSIDPPRAEVHAQLRAAQVLVLPSQGTPSWREQVGLPIVEALAHGTAVVTTTETGLADWLSANGHQTIASGADVEALAGALLTALRQQRPAEDVLADLPARDGRLAADQWMFDAV